MEKPGRALEAAKRVQIHEEAEKKEEDVTLTVAECGEFHNYGEFAEMEFMMAE